MIALLTLSRAAAAAGREPGGSGGSADEVVLE